MRKLLIVDDDAIICRGLKENIDWAAHGCEVIGSASNGEEAFAMIRQHTPDIVITDIRMPFMDGLALTQAIKAEYPLVKVILLTGYEDFEYARQALNLKASEYILKPVDTPQLIQAVLRAAQELERDILTRKQIEYGLPLLKRKYWRQLIAGVPSDDPVASDLLRQQASFFNGYLIVLAIRLDECDPARTPPSVDTVLDLLNGLLREGEQGVAIDTGENEFVVVRRAIDYRSTPPEAVSETIRLAHRIREEVGSRLRCTASVGVGSVCDKMEELSRSYREACSALAFRHLQGINQVYYIGDTGFPQDSGDLLPGSRSRMQELQQKAKLGLGEDAIRVVEAIRSDIRNRSFVSIQQIRLIGIEMAHALFTAQEEDAAGAADGNKYQVYRELQDMQTVDEIFGKITELATEICQAVCSRREDQQRKVVEAAKAYIARHYAKPDLSLTEIADHVHVSPTYLSSIFKQKLNVNYSDYLLAVRMEKAMELLRGTDLKIYEVSEQVGYNNAQYFSLCFKKYCDCSPLEFKNK